jgi:hypothetical protein
VPHAETTQPDHAPDYTPDHVGGGNDAETGRLEDRAPLHHGATQPALKVAGLAPILVGACTVKPWLDRLENSGAPISVVSATPSA